MLSLGVPGNGPPVAGGAKELFGTWNSGFNEVSLV